VRWKVVAVLAVLVGVFWYLGLDSYAFKEVNRAGRSSDAARWSIKDLGLGLLGADLSIQELLVATPKRGGEKAAAAPAAAGPGESGAPLIAPEEKVFNAPGAEFNLSMMDALRKRFVVDKVGMQAPKLSVTRREDGSINVEDIGPPSEETEPGPRAEDWLGSIKKWYERIQKVREKLGRREGEAKPAPSEEKPGAGVDYDRAVTYPFEGRPGMLVHTIEATGFEIEFADSKASAPLPPLKNGKVVISEVSNSPGTQEVPTTWEVAGEIAGAPLSIKGTLDFRKGAGLFQLDAASVDVPASVVEAFIAPSLPVKLKEGKVSVDAKILLDGRDRMEVLPRLAFKGIQLEAKDPRGKVAGVDAAQFVTAFNEASTQLDALVIEDLKITGSLASPRFEWGDTVKNLIVNGGKAFAQKQIDKGLAKGKEALEKEAAKALEKAPLDPALKEKIKGLPGADKVKDGLGNLGKGLFGGDEKETPRQEEKK
jgi:hypothetical protein